MASSRQPRRVSDELRALIERAMRRLTFRVFQALTSANPVDTGFSRAGWIPSTQAPAPGPSTRPTVRSDAEALAARLFAKHSDAARAIRDGYKLQSGAVYIVNNVGYVIYLNQGTSAQAPAMFIERAIQTAIAETQRELSR